MPEYRVEVEEVPPPGWIPVELAAHLVVRKPRTIYDWIKIEGLRAVKVNGKLHVNYEEIEQVDTIRRRGRRSKPRLPNLGEPT